MKFRAAKRTYRKYREDEIPDDDMNVQLIRQHMLDRECMRYYHNCLPQLDMLAAHHFIKFDKGTANHNDLASLRSEGAEVRRGARLDNELQAKIKDTSQYVSEAITTHN
jgi:hypothetical protein